MKYPGAELDNFDKATIWRKYVFLLIKKFIKGNVLEVGAGIGSFTNNYMHIPSEITLSEIDEDNLLKIKNKFANTNFSFTNNTIKDLNETYDTIMYLNVLEHIADDKNEIVNAYKKLNKGGHLIILVPAHNKLFSKFDEAVGHFKRYEIEFFKKIFIEGSLTKKLLFLDSMGYFLYYLNKIFFSDETYPSKIKILIWDKIFTPISIILDKIFFYRYGKNILYILKKL